MSRMVDYFYTHSSPWTYLGSARFHDIAKAAQTSINYRPCNLGRIFSQSGGLPLPKRAQQRQRYRMFELKRWRDHLGVEITLEPNAGMCLNLGKHLYFRRVPTFWLIG